METAFAQLHTTWRVVIVITIAVLLQLFVVIIKKIDVYLTQSNRHPSLSKTRTLSGLIASVLSFSAYFIAIGVILSEFGISLTAYIASASIIGFAVAFGSQSIVQDVVIGLTIILNGLFDIGDMVEISGQTGIVKRVSMRFTVIENAFGAEVFIPNRSIANVINYPKGYVRCLVDVTLSAKPDVADKQEALVAQLMQSMVDQYPGIFCKPPESGRKFTISSGRRLLRVKFRIWPGRGAPIENQFRQEMLQKMKILDPDYSDWMLAVSYEVE